MREHSLAKVPVMLVVGKKEAAERMVSIRRLGKEGQQVMPLDAALKVLADEAVPPDSCEAAHEAQRRRLVMRRRCTAKLRALTAPAPRSRRRRRG